VVLVDGQPVRCKFVLCETVLVDDLHLLHDRRLADSPETAGGSAVSGLSGAAGRRPDGQGPVYGEGGYVGGGWEGRRENTDRGAKPCIVF
jgi:hypothetical protein